MADIMKSGIVAYIIVIILISGLHHTTAVDTIVTTPNIGSVKGQIIDVPIDSRSTQIAEFLGIPYAEPPTGQLRFAKPKPKARFNDTFEASQYGPACLQVTYPFGFGVGKTDTMSEDCLSLNIHAPVNGSELYPVMVYIHGGGFIVGESRYLKGHILAAYGEVVVVTMNYRLGLFGFLSTEDQHAPGNAGLWDQRLAIKWVKDNIEAFGGNSSIITVFGESAGSSSVGFQVLYKENIGLFQNAIMESGSPRNNLFAFSSAGQSLSYAKTLASKLSCDSSSNMEIVKCLRDIQNATLIQARGNEILAQIRPRIDEDFVTSDAYFATEWPQNKDTSTGMNPSHNFNLIIGTNTYEGHYFMMAIYSRIVNQMKNATVQEANGIYKMFLQQSLGPNTSERMVDAVMFQYSNAANPSDRILLMRQMSHYVTDTLFFLYCSKDVHSHAHMNNNTKTYQYEFNVNPKFKNLPGSDWMDGATHTAELGFVFGWPSSYKLVFNFTEETKQANWPMSKLIMDYWTNFAKTGNPNHPRDVPTQWREFDLDDKDYLHFPSEESPEVRQFLNAKRLAFWEEYVPKLINMEATDAPPTICQPTSISSKIQHSLLFFVLLAVNAIRYYL